LKTMNYIEEGLFSLAITGFTKLTTYMAKLSNFKYAGGTDTLTIGSVLKPLGLTVAGATAGTAGGAVIGGTSGAVIGAIDPNRYGTDSSNGSIIGGVYGSVTGGITGFQTGTTVMSAAEVGATVTAFGGSTAVGAGTLFPASFVAIGGFVTGTGLAELIKTIPGVNHFLDTNSGVQSIAKGTADLIHTVIGPSRNQAITDPVERASLRKAKILAQDQMSQDVIDSHTVSKFQHAVQDPMSSNPVKIVDYANSQHTDSALNESRRIALLYKPNPVETKIYNSSWFDAFIEYISKKFESYGSVISESWNNVVKLAENQPQYLYGPIILLGIIGMIIKFKLTKSNLRR